MDVKFKVGKTAFSQHKIKELCRWNISKGLQQRYMANIDPGDWDVT